MLLHDSKYFLSQERFISCITNAFVHFKVPSLLSYELDFSCAIQVRIRSKYHLWFIAHPLVVEYHLLISLLYLGSQLQNLSVKNWKVFYLYQILCCLRSSEKMVVCCSDFVQVVVRKFLRLFLFLLWVECIELEE